ncbi:MAG: hypothetical protein Q7J16_00035, partial [Candidatus Cloacimonadales bacterium]|nr:hypothetical protein [Candidatus Cloacimonadales bacterium]
MKNLMILLYFVFGLYLSATIINIPADQPTIQAGINVATIGDTVLVQPGTYYENINYNGKNITVASLFLTTQDTTYISQTIIDGNQNGRVVTIENAEDSTAVLSGFTITNGNADFGGGIYCYYSNISLQNIIITGNSSTMDGGGIYCNNSELNLENVTISNNSVIYYGGGIYCLHSNLLLQNVILTGNSSTMDGGGIYNFYSDLELENVSISSNYATRDGGGLYSAYGSHTTF